MRHIRQPVHVRARRVEVTPPVLVLRQLSREQVEQAVLRLERYQVGPVEDHPQHLAPRIGLDDRAYDLLHVLLDVQGDDEGLSLPAFAAVLAAVGAAVNRAKVQRRPADEIL